MKFIKDKLDEYLEFDSNEIFSCGDLIRIFGGAIRDIIAQKEIHDIDILVGSRSVDNLMELLKSKGYYHYENLIGKDLSKVYSDIQIINVPHTLVKGPKIVQVIRPATASELLYSPNDKVKNSVSELHYKRGFQDLISNVDFSCCGLSWKSSIFDEGHLFENCPDAVLHAKNHVYVENKSAKMYSRERAVMRSHKLALRGWKQIGPNDVSSIRDFKLETILGEDDLVYIKEY